MIRRLILVVMFPMVLCAQEKGEVITDEQVTASLNKDLENARSRLSLQRATLSEEKVTLSKAYTKLVAELREKRRKTDLARRSTESQKRLVDEWKKRVRDSSIEVSVLSDKLKKYGIQLQALRFPGQDDESRLASVFSKSVDTNKSLEDRFAVIEAGIDSIEAALGGQIFEVDATDADSKEVRGKVAVFGPLQWFASDDGKTAGSYHVSVNREVASVDEDEKLAALALTKGGEASARIDITGGKAKALASIKNGPLDLVKKGGAWVYPILAVAFLALLCAVIKFSQLAGIRRPKRVWSKKVSDLIVSGDVDQAVEEAKGVSHPVGMVLPPCLSVVQGSLEVAEEILYEHMIDVRDKLRRWLPFIAITAAISPLLGLLGTVSGLINTFSVISVEGTGEAQSISGGISEALVTTLFGLAVAIPAFVMHAVLSRKAKGIEQTTERLALGIINDVRKDKIK